MTVVSGPGAKALIPGFPVDRIRFLLACQLVAYGVYLHIQTKRRTLDGGYTVRIQVLVYRHKCLTDSDLRISNFTGLSPVKAFLSAVFT